MNTIQYREGGSLAKENKEMLMNQAIELKHHADELIKVLEQSDYIEPWVVSKAERATTDLSDITHYLEGNSKKMKWGGYMQDGGEVSEFNLEQFLNFIFPNVKEIMDSNNISIDKDFIVSKDMQIAYVPHFMYEYEDEKVSELAIYYFDAQDKHIGHIEIDLEEKEIEVEFPTWGLEDEDKYERGGYMENGGKVYVDLFDERDEMPYKVEVIVDKYEDEYGEDIPYQSLLDMQRDVEKVGYTFDFGLDSIPYGLRPIGVDITQLRDYDDDNQYGNGGAKFSEKVKSISKRLNRTQVPSKYRSEYGKTYNKKESELAASRIAGAMIKKGY